MKNILFICVKNPFCERDMERMGIEALEKYFDVRILDCTAWLMPKALHTRGPATVTRRNLYFVRSLRELLAQIKYCRSGFVLDYVGQFSIRAVLLFHVLKSKGIKLIVVDSGAYPPPDSTPNQSTHFEKLVEAYRHGGLGPLLSGKIGSWMLKLLPDQSPDFALISGTSWQSNPRIASAANKIPAHSFDYEIFRNLRRDNQKHSADYVVYLDETIAGHEDNKELGLAEPATTVCFYPALNKFFECFEELSGLKVVVAGYPSSRAAEFRDNFGQRQVVFGQTAALIRDAKLIFAHASTAISYAVLWRKPIVFLTSDEILHSWYQPWIEAPHALLGTRLVNIDIPFRALVQDKDNLRGWFCLDLCAYEKYENCFIKASSSPDMSLWDILSCVRNI